MNDRALRYFLAVVRTGSIRAAADILNVAPSAVSRQIAEMEADSGMILLERLPRGVMPTDAGRVVAEHAQRNADETVLLGDRLRLLRGVQKGTVRISCGQGFVYDVMEYGLAPFSAHYPDVSFILTTGTTGEIQSAIATGEVDIGLGINPTGHPEVDSAVMSPQPIAAIVLPGHPLAEATHPVDLRMFAAEPAAMPPTGSMLRQLLGRIETDGNFRLVARLETGSFDLQKRFVILGMGVSFMPASNAARELDERSLVAIPLSDALLQQVTAHLLLRRGRRLPEAVKSLATWFGENLLSFRAPV
jgi:DNA-binding transcriptional LysR family regulator